MSRTYRKIPHWASKKRLIAGFTDGYGHWSFHSRLNDFTNVDDYVKAATAHYRGERGSGWSGMKNQIAPNGNVIGDDEEATRCPASRTRTNKLRRAQGKNEIVAAISEMVDDEQVSIDELMQMDNDLFGDIDISHWLDWDDFDQQDFDPEPEDDYCKDDYIDPFEDDFYDPYWDMEYEYR